VSRTRDANFPLEPLLVAARGETIAGLARQLGVSRRSVHRWKLHGIQPCVAMWAADEIDIPPSIIWPIEWWAYLDLLDQRQDRRRAQRAAYRDARRRAS
jgi:hypothetical protein